MMSSDEEINGAAFVLLSEDDLKDLGFKMGARRVILEIINSTQVIPLPCPECCVM